MKEVRDRLKGDIKGFSLNKDGVLRRHGPKRTASQIKNHMLNNFQNLVLLPTITYSTENYPCHS